MGRQTGTLDRNGRSILTEMLKEQEETLNYMTAGNNNCIQLHKFLHKAIHIDNSNNCIQPQTKLHSNHNLQTRSHSKLNHCLHSLVVVLVVLGKFVHVAVTEVCCRLLKIELRNLFRCCLVNDYGLALCNASI